MFQCLGHAWLLLLGWVSNYKHARMVPMAISMYVCLRFFFFVWPPRLKEEIQEA